MARPRSGDWLDDEIAGWQAQNIDIVISLLDREETEELGLTAEAELCRRSGIEFVSLPIPDRGVPADLADVERLAQASAISVQGGKTVVVHCRAGIGRSSLIASCILVCTGVAPEAALDAIRAARGVEVPDTDEQREWVMAFAGIVSGRRGRFPPGE